MVKASLKLSYEQKPVYHRVEEKRIIQKQLTHFINAQISMVTGGGGGRGGGAKAGSGAETFKVQQGIITVSKLSQ